MANGTATPPVDVDEFMKSQAAGPPVDVDEFMKSQGPADISSEASMAAHPPTPKLTSTGGMAVGPTMTGASPRVARVESLATRATQPIAPTIDQMRATNVGAGKFGAESLMGQVIAGPIARATESTVLPELGRIPVIGKSIAAVGAAPTLAGKVISGAAQGAGYGGLEGMVRGHGVVGSLKDAAKGGLYGAGMGLVIPGIGYVARTADRYINRPIPNRPIPNIETAAPTAAEQVPPVKGLLTEGATPLGYTDTSGPVPAAERMAHPMAPFRQPIGPEPGPVPEMAPAVAPQAPAAAPRVATGPTSAARVPRSTVIPPIAAPEPPVAQVPEPSTVTAPVTIPPVEAPQQAIPSLDEVVNKATGVKPLQPNVPIREQLTGATAEAPLESPEAAAFKAKYPDKPTRAMAMANGEPIVDAVGNNPELMKQVHDLTRVDLRQALINSGEDMGQKTVTNSKFAGEGGVTRQDAFGRLLQKGYTPQQIVDMAKPSIPNIGETADAYLQSLGEGGANHPEVEVGGEEGIQTNASGESAASREAISRNASEKARGEQRFKIDTRTGKEVPLYGPDAVDIAPQAHEVIVKRGPKGEELVTSGSQANYRPKPPGRGSL